ncbi:MAG: thioredoxin-disulfide reductase [Bacilli bacterium]|nr:thioredoxin-disulfide reductase [Bacilli bacterium]
MYDIIIIGAGPAGLTAAIYARRAGKKVLVLEGNTYGGQIINTLSIENYPVEPHISGFDFATKLYNQVLELGAEIKFERVLEVSKDKTVKTKKSTYQGSAIILATGAENRKLGLERESELTGKGISYCATCDGAFYKGKEVAVVGGGNTALEDAIYLSNLANKVYLIHRRDEFRGEQSYVEELKKKENIEIIYNSQVTKFNGKEHLESIEITNKNNDKRTLHIEGLFIAVGRNPENENFKELIALDAAGYAIASEDCHTNVKGIFVAGDNRTKELRQLVTATSDGAVAATEAIKYIQGKELQK